MKNYDVVILGGGSAGMAAAVAARQGGATTAIIESDNTLGGILNQCIHNGFGLHYFKEELTGPEYAARFKQLVEQSGADIYLNTSVLEIHADKTIKAVSPEGMLDFCAKSVVIAFGCRERSAGAICLAGDRPSGIYTAGFAQKLCNIQGLMAGKKVVILGSGDIGLIMARRMTFEGAEVKAVVELMPYSSGLKRNIVQCVMDFNIPLYYSHTVTRVEGKDRVEKVFIAPVDDNKQPLLQKEFAIDCDCLLLSVGLIPSVDLALPIGAIVNKTTSGFVVDEYRQTTKEGFFACGNMLHVHDLVDNVTAEGELAGKWAAEYAKAGKLQKAQYKVNAAEGVRYALPNYIAEGEGNIKIYLRSDNVYKNCRLNVKCNDEVIYTKKYQIISPGEMESINIDKNKIKGDIVVCLEK